MMLLQVLPRLTDFNHVVCSLSSIGSVGEKIKALGIPVYALENGRRFSLSSILKFKKIVGQYQPTILSTRLIHADIFGRIFGRIFGIKKIHCHLESILDQPKYDKLFLLERLTSGLVTKYSAVSRSVKNKYINKAKINPIRIEVIYNGIDLDKFSNLPDKITAKKMLGMENFYPLIGYAAKMRPERNHKHLLQTLAELKNLQAALLLAGDGPEKENLQQLAGELKISERVFFLGNRDDVPRILAALDIFVSPSAYEGMSVAILEAMAAGLPIIASNIEPNKELIENNVNGFLADSTNPQEIAAQIFLLANDPEKSFRFGRLAKEKAQLFSLEKTVVGLQKLYREI